PMHGPRRLQVIDIKSKQFTVRWEPFGYNVTRCHNYSLTVEYRYTLNAEEETREEKCTDTLSISPQHTIRNLLPFTNVSVKLVLRNPEGVKESEELNVLTDEDVPGTVPLESIQGSTYEEKIALRWREPIQTYGIIKQYEIFYKAVSSFDPEFNLANQSGKVLKFSNETSHVFVGLYPGSTYSFTIRASTVKGYGPPVITQFTSKISRKSITMFPQELTLNQSECHLSFLLRQSQMTGAPVSVYQVVVEEERPRRSRRAAEILRCYPIPIHFQNTSVLNSQYYFTAEFPAGRIQSPLPFTVGDNRTYDGYWNLPLLPHKSYSIYYQAVSTANGETKIDCVRVATKAAIIVTQLTTPYVRIAPAAGDSQLTGAATRKPDAVEPEKQTDHTVKIAGVIAGILLFVIIFLGVVLVMKKRRSSYSYTYYLKLAKKRKETLSSTRQEMTVMVNSMDKSYTEQGTSCDEAISFMDTHNLNGRPVSSPSSFTMKTNTLTTSVPNSYYPDPFVPTAILDEPHTMTSETSSLVQSHTHSYKKREAADVPYQTGQLHPAIRVADLLQHITQMKCAEGYGFKEEYESFFEGQAAPWDSAKKDENRMKNRYGNIIAYDHSRVRLQPVEGEQSSDYINANYVDGYHRPNHYIATQGNGLHVLCRRTLCDFIVSWKLAKKRKETLSSTRQEMTVMVNSMDKSYTEQGTSCDEAISFMDTHNLNGRPVSSPSSFTMKTNTLTTSVPNSYYPDPFVPTAILDEPHTMTSETSSLVQSHTHSYKKREAADVPYQTGQLHPAIRVADLLQHITQMKCAEGYGFKEEYESFFEGQAAPWDSAKKDENRMKNRYGNIIAYDHSRVRLQPVEGEQSSDYINANYVDGYHRPNHYIATQGPMQETIYDFWRMVWQENTATIVMVTNLVEVGRVSCPMQETIYDFWRMVWQENTATIVMVTNLVEVGRTLNMVTPTLRVEDCSIALLPRNHEKNRCMDVLPPDRCLPFLITIDGESSNYINAALMDSYKQPSAFIVTQHPLPNTVKDFWRLVLDYHCTSIVMLNDVDPAQLCPQYWPENGVHRHGPIQVEFVSADLEEDIISRIFRIYNAARPQDGYRMVQQFQFLGWPMYRDTPVSKRSFLKLIRQVDKWQEEYDGGEGRTVVHCLNGGGRSGAFCAISIVCEMLRQQHSVDVFHAVKTLRNNKPNMVDLLDQYKFCYEVAVEYLNSG
ncbi:receptor-type tyrosine-protein phosphatase mu-like, partial [Triplophysa rosa]|uniref:receptor-type tyrosine-protein phosphatase mu-like n=1 Tax=Triplophysa rosa TaxID=992332 RepID=UPI002545C87C